MHFKKKFVVERGLNNRWVRSDHVEFAATLVHTKLILFIRLLGDDRFRSIGTYVDALNNMKRRTSSSESDERKESPQDGIHNIKTRPPHIYDNITRRLLQFGE